RARPRLYTSSSGAAAFGLLPLAPPPALVRGAGRRIGRASLDQAPRVEGLRRLAQALGGGAESAPRRQRRPVAPRPARASFEGGLGHVPRRRPAARRRLDRGRGPFRA